MNLSAPKNTTFLVAVVLGLLGLLGFIVQLPFITANAFWLVVVGFILLTAAVMVPDL